VNAIRDEVDESIKRRLNYLRERIEAIALA